MKREWKWLLAALSIAVVLIVLALLVAGGYEFGGFTIRKEVTLG